MSVDVNALADRRRARWAGVLFILATVSSIAGGLMILPIQDGAVDAADRAAMVRSGALLELVLAASVVSISVVLYPVLRRRFEALALGYVAARVLEAALILVATLSALVVVNVGQGGSASQLLAVDQLLTLRDWAYFLGTVFVFSVSALVLNCMLFGARLVPAWLSVWGIVGAVAIGIGGVFALYVTDASEAVDIDVVWAAAIGIQEMALAIWLIWRGFSSDEAD